MATETTNYKLVKPDVTDFVNIKDHFNANLDKIDQLINERIEKAMIAHNLTTKDTNMVLGADVGQAISQAISSMQESKADKTAIPTVLPANGGNADTLDSKHASDFALSTHTHSKTVIGLGNVDNTADANKSVNYANTAGNASNSDTVDGWHMNLAVGGWGIKPICAGTGDMTAGTTDLAQGHVYIVYE
jgi:hypothetical protein